MIELRVGDLLPCVAAVQAGLNEYFRDPNYLAVDADFGPQTLKAVREFQRQTGTGRGSGHVEASTWTRLFGADGWQIRDIVDVFEDSVQRRRQVLEDIGGRPIVFAGGSYALAWVKPSLVGSGKLSILRLHGHGGPGEQILGHGSNCQVLWKAIRGKPVQLKKVKRRMVCGWNATNYELDAVFNQAVPYS